MVRISGSFVRCPNQLFNRLSRTCQGPLRINRRGSAACRYSGWVVLAASGFVVIAWCAGSAGGAAVEEAAGGEVSDDGEADAPGDGGDPFVAEVGAEQESAQGFGDGGEWLVFGELAQAGAHGGGGHESAAAEGQEDEGHWQVAGAFG